MITRKFGIGCFHFEYKENLTPFKFKPSEYIQQVNDLLSSLNSLSELEIIKHHDHAYDHEYTINELISLADDGGFFPLLSGLEISFKLFIPKRIQENFEHRRPYKTGTENFRVILTHSYWAPVALIECCDFQDECDPSNAVILVREYLKKELADKSDFIKFECLGPSPFHVNFTSILKPSPSTNVSHTVQELTGYDEITFHVDTPFDSGIKTLWPHISAEFGLYYFVKNEINSIHTTWSGLAELKSELEKLTDTCKFWNIKKRFEIHEKSKELLTSAYNFKIDNELIVFSLNSSMSSMYNKDVYRVIEKRIYDVMKEIPKFPTDAMIEWVKQINLSTFKIVEISALLISSCLGGAVGAMLTFLLTN